MKECSFDKTADAVRIFDRATSNYNDEYNLITDRSIRFKILKESGIERGNIHILFYSKDKIEFIARVNAVIATPDKDKGYAWTNLDQKTVYTKKINDYYSEVVFAMPNVKVGSIIEYEYESVKQHYGYLDDWYFQDEIPTILSSYKLYVVPNASFNYVIKKSPFMQVSVHPEASEASVQFEMKNIPGLRDEAFSTSYHDYLQKVNFQLSMVVSRNGAQTRFSNNWKELNRDFLDSREFGAQLNKNLSSSFSQLWAKYNDPYQKMAAIHDYVRTNFQWNGMDSKYASDALKNIVQKKSGTSGDLNLLLINLLKDADFTVYPLLVSERSHGRVDTTISFQDQFNKVVALVNIGDRNYVLDASDPVTPSNMIPLELLNTIGFAVDRKNYGFVHLIDNLKSNTCSIQIDGKINTSGTMNGYAVVNYIDYARVGEGQHYLKNKQKYISKFSNPVAGFKIDSFNVVGVDDDTTTLRNELSIEYPLSQSGNYYILTYNLFTGFEKNPFISDYRFTDIDFGTKYNYTLHASFDLPDQFQTDALPKTVVLRTPGNELEASREVKKNGNSIEVNASIRINTEQYDATDYSIIKEFFGKMIDMLNEPVLLIKKN